jgi:hypothetical protein
VSDCSHAVVIVVRHPESQTQIKLDCPLLGARYLHQAKFVADNYGTV